MSKNDTSKKMIDQLSADNLIEDEGAKSISIMLRLNTTLTLLNLRGEEDREIKRRDKRMTSELQAMQSEMRERRWSRMHGEIVVVSLSCDGYDNTLHILTSLRRLSWS